MAVFYYRITAAVIYMNSEFHGTNSLLIKLFDVIKLVNIFLFLIYCF